jgi:(p)ppGpp synthase/HD superfamily hydrolase
MRRPAFASWAAAALILSVAKVAGLSAPPAPPPDKPKPNPADEPRAPRRLSGNWESWDSAVNVAFRPWDDAAQLLTSVERRRAFDPKPRRQDVEGGRWWTRLSQTIFPVERADDGLLVGDTWAELRNSLEDDDVRESADRATRLLTDWASEGSAARQLAVNKGASVASYVSRTPFGTDAAVVAAALLCDAHEETYGEYRGPATLPYEAIVEALGAETADLSRDLANLAHLCKLQRARWGAGTMWGDPRRGLITGFGDQDDALLRSCRLPRSHAQNLQEMLVAVAGDFRSLPLLLARHLEALHEECAERRDAEEARRLERLAGGTVEELGDAPSSLARDALDVLAPLADRFGLNQLKTDLEDAAFERLAPKARRRICDALESQRSERDVVLEDVTRRLKRNLYEDDVVMNGVSSLRVYAREKAPFSIWRKQRRLGASNGEVKMPPDVVACRVVLDPLDKKDDSALCYHVLDRVRKVWRSNENRTKDYIAHPKLNGYRSLHATAKTRLHGAVYDFEVQIRTRDMHLVAEFGSAAHSLYIDGSSDRMVPSFSPGNETRTSRLGAKAGRALGDALRSERVFVVAEGGRVLTLGSSAKTCEARGALLEDLRRDEAEMQIEGPVEVNGRRPDWIESLDTPLNNGDEVRWAPPAEIRPRRWPGV